MNRREYFIAAALQSVVADAARRANEPGYKPTPEAGAQAAIRWADAVETELVLAECNELERRLTLEEAKDMCRDSSLEEAGHVL